MSVAATGSAMVRSLAAAAALLACLLSLPAAAKVTQVNERGFVVRLVATVPAEPGKVWDELVNPADWWDSEHSFSGSAANFKLDPRPGGCFCETLPGAEPAAPPRGGVEHMIVVYAEKDRALRMRGALGPLQADAVVAMMTIQLKPDEGGGTQILWEYVVGGFMRAPVDSISASVDRVLGEQLERLALKLGAKPEAAASSAKDGPPAGPADKDAPAKGEVIGR